MQSPPPPSRRTVTWPRSDKEESLPLIMRTRGQTHSRVWQTPPYFPDPCHFPSIRAAIGSVLHTRTLQRSSISSAEFIPRRDHHFSRSFAKTKWPLYRLWSALAKPLANSSEFYRAHDRFKLVFSFQCFWIRTGGIKKKTRTHCQNCQHPMGVINTSCKS